MSSHGNPAKTGSAPGTTSRRPPTGVPPCRVGIIGSGALAAALLPHLREQRVPVAGLWGRNTRAAAGLGKRNQVRVFPKIDDLVQTCTLLILAVSDDAIESVGKVIAQAPVAGRLVIHASGSRSLEALDPVRSAGGETAVVHPLMTMTWSSESARPLSGAPLGVVCSNRKRGTLLRSCLAGMGHPIFRLPAGDRPGYHAAAVMACAGLYRLFQAAAGVLAEAGSVTPKQGRSLLAPMARRALELAVRSPKGGISGPWGRGDAGTVRLHRAALRATHPQILRLYEALMDLTTEPR